MSDDNETQEQNEEQSQQEEQGWSDEQIEAFEMDAFLTWLFQSDK